MSRGIVPTRAAPGIRVVPNVLTCMVEALARRVVISSLRKIARGHITLVDGESERVFGRGTASGLGAELTVRNPAFYSDVAFGGSIGAAEAYLSGYWSADDLTTLIRIIIQNQEVLTDIEGGFARLTGPLHRMIHWLRKNSKKGSRRNIMAHYDIGNNFFSLFLDETMTYSCNIFERQGATLEEAANAKYDRICRKLGIGPGDHVLEIGTGWGGFAIHAAKRYGCRVTTTTISRQQYTYAKDLIEKKGLSGKIELLCEDYRELQGAFDKLVSIEMIEAVGHDFLEMYFRCCSERLKPGGLMALQAITISDEYHDSHIRSADFIRRYVFPGGSIPSVPVLRRAATGASGLRLADLEDITPHYVQTLRIWRDRFFSRIDEVRRTGYPESFIRMWEYYLCYCEAGFIERYIGDVQMIFAKPSSRREPASTAGTEVG